MTIDLAQAKADWEATRYLSDPLPYVQWCGQHAEPLLTALEARSGDMELAKGLAEFVHDTDWELAGFVRENADAILKSLKGGV